ncbi:oleate hydratase [Penicillium lividum]|nr:oleate hydratase [Penicillium lividum]
MSGPDQDQQHHKDLHVWILGSSIGSLATAVFLIRDAEIPAPQIHLVESRGAPEDGLPTTGDAASGEFGLSGHLHLGSVPGLAQMNFVDAYRNFFKIDDLMAPSVLLTRFTCDPQEDIILPITHLLQKEGINLHFDVTVTDIVMVQEQDSRRISAFKWMEDEKEILVNVVKHDIVIATLGSSVSGPTSGTNTQPPSLELLKAEDRLDANWSLWLAFGSSLGDPYNFCKRVEESRVETFTTTFQGPDCFNHFVKSVKAEVGSRTLIVLQKSNWSINLLIHINRFSPINPKMSA